MKSLVAYHPFGLTPMKSLVTSHPFGLTPMKSLVASHPFGFRSFALIHLKRKVLLHLIHLG